jgi:hypothetical protein
MTSYGIHGRGTGLDPVPTLLRNRKTTTSSPGLLR